MSGVEACSLARNGTLERPDESARVIFNEVDPLIPFVRRAI